MKKIKFFNGISATFALAAVALATTFTSCEKEDFNVNFEPNPAKVVFTPNVIDAATGSSVTAVVKVDGKDALEIVSTQTDKALPAGKVKITATANNITGEIEVSYPAVAAGQIVSISPVIFLSSELVFTANEGSAVPVGSPKVRYGNGSATPDNPTLDHAGKVWNTNKSDYAVEFTASWNLIDAAIKAGADTKAVTNIPGVFNVDNIGEKPLKVGSWCMYNAVYTIQPANLKYKVTSKVSSDVIAEVVYYNPIYTVTVAAEQMAIPGHEHAFGHGHGHGGNPNAGGGISLAD
ncbi:DUF3869 domain-containing protein [Bacteroides sp.]|uniref:DUF3869 domain-containing protein n=1 Tax=Bacteroides sp. TaxID=29523 RepID=UPI0026140217|nr:DUF3869 domain-containing protein [Bacteroides sp.]